MNFYEQLFCRGRTTGEGMTHFERLFAAKFGGSPLPTVREYTGAVPVTITADGTPLIDYLISGNATQNGTPTPDNPIMPQGTGERTGNLLPSPALETKSNNGITVRSDGAGRYYVSGTAENDAYITFNIPPFLIPMSVGSNGNGTFSMFNTKTYQNDAVKIEFYYQGTLVDNWGLINLNRTSTNYSAMANRTTDTVGIFVKSGTTVDFQISPEFTNDGVLPSEYEPYGYKIPISSANTTTPVYLGEVQTTRRIKKLVLTGKESFEVANSCFILWLYSVQYPNPKQEIIYCTHYKGRTPTYRDSLTNGQCMITKNQNQIAIKDLSYATIDDFKAYLQQQYAAGTPVTLWYALAEPETGILNEPLMRIGDYADTLSKAQAGVQIPTNNGSTTVDVDTTVKPSEVYIKYMG